MRDKKIVFKGDYPDELSMEMLKEAGIRVVKFVPDSKIQC